MKDKIKYSFSGHSLVINSLLVAVNLLGVLFLTMGYHDSFVESKWVYVGAGYALILLSIGGIFVFKGGIMMSFVSRVLVGSLFIVSGLIKANDPIGFSYKLEEYFEDGALAFRIKEWFSMPDFSLEFFIPYALTLSVIICIVEIILGVLVLIGGKIKLTSWLLLLMIAFFTFLTWHTSSCDPNKKFIDRDTYAINSSLAQIKIEEAKTNKEIKIISKTNGKVVVDELKGTQCVLDCGCFGDAMKGSVGRSLTPKETLWKDILLFYFIVWIFATQWRIKPNTTRENTIVVLVSMALMLVLSFIFGWYFPFIFGLIAILSALWMRQSGGVLLGNYFGSTLVVTFLCGLMTTYVLMYEPLKDYRPYAVGSDLTEKMNDGIMGEFKSAFKMKDLKTGSDVLLTEEEYMDPVKKLWEDSTLQFVSMESLEIKKGKLPSIDSSQFSPTIDVSNLSDIERKLPYIDSILSENMLEGVLLYDHKIKNEIEVLKEDYDTSFYTTENYRFVREIGIVNPDLMEISVRDMIVKSPKVIALFSRNLKEANWQNVDKLKEIFRRAQKDSVPFILVTSSTRKEIDAFRKKYKFDVPIFIMDFIEIKVVCRSNPSLMIVMDGVVKGKYPYRSTPTYDWIQKHVFYKDIK